MSKWILRHQAVRRGVVCIALAVLALTTLAVLVRRSQASVLPAESTAAPSAAIHAVPGSDGASVYVGAGRLGQLAIPVYAHITVLGPTSHERSHTMTYDPAKGEYGHTFEGIFTAATTAEGSINITTTITPTLGSSSYVRYYVSGSSTVDLPSTDGRVNLHISAGGVPTGTYVLIMPTNAPPDDPLPGHRFIGQAYAIRASGALTESLQPMVLRISYETVWLSGADPHTLSLFAWDASGQQWLDLGGNPFFDWYYLSQTVRRFTTYALMATTTWRDTFDDIYGLSERHNVRLAYGGKLELASGATSGWAVSVPITPTGDFTAWSQLSYSTVITTSTALTVSVLDGRTGEELLSNVADGASLAAIDPATYPSLRLRVTLSADTLGETPSLDEWIISWLPATEGGKLYLPLIIKGTPPPTGTSPKVVTALSDIFPIDLTDQPISQPVRAVQMPLVPSSISSLSVNTGTIIITGTGWQRIMLEDFEGTFPPPHWIVDDTSPIDGGEYLWGERDCKVLSGSYSLWAGGGGEDGELLVCGDTYANNLLTWLIYGPADLSQVTDAEIQFALWTDVEGDEQGPVLIDVVFWGASTDGIHFFGPATAGQTGGWIPTSLNLGDVTGEPEVYLGWVFDSNESNPTTYKGAFVDDTALWVYTDPFPTPPPPTPTLPITRHTTLADFAGGRSNDRTVIGAEQGDGALTLAAQVNAMGDWERLPNLPESLFNFAAVTAKGYLFVIGGNAPGGRYQRQVYSAAIQDNGLLSHWAEVTQLPQALMGHSAVVANDHLFVLGGFNANGFQSTVFSAPINDDGTLGEWKTTLPALPEPLAVNSAVPTHGYIYVLGGRTSNDPLMVSDAIYRARVNANGTLSDWETLLTPLPRPSMWHEVVVTCDRLYMMAGQDAVINEYADVYQAEIHHDGSLGAWSQATSLPKTLAAHAAVAVRGGILVTGGWSTPDPVSTVQRSVYWASLGPDCSLGNWVELTPLPYRTYQHALAATDHYIYNLGGVNSLWAFASVLMSPLQLDDDSSVQRGTFNHQFYLGDNYTIKSLHWIEEGNSDTEVGLRYRVGDADTGEYGLWSSYTSTNPITISASGGFLEYQLKFAAGSGSSDKYVSQVSLSTTTCAANTAPTIADLPDQVVPMNGSADNAIDLWAYTNDTEDITATLTFAISNVSPISVGATIDTNRYIDINPFSGWIGTSEVEVQVQDTGGLTDTDTFSITVLSNIYLPVVLRK